MDNKQQLKKIAGISSFRDLVYLFDGTEEEIISHCKEMGYTWEYIPVIRKANHAEIAKVEPDSKIKVCHKNCGNTFCMKFGCTEFEKSKSALKAHDKIPNAKDIIGIMHAHLLFSPHIEAITEIVESYALLREQRAVEQAKEECWEDIKKMIKPSCDDHTPYMGNCVSCGNRTNYDEIDVDELIEYFKPLNNGK